MNPITTQAQQVSLALQYLSQITHTKTATKASIRSYAAKHRAEAFFKAQGLPDAYISEQALLLAASQLGVPMLPYGGEGRGAYLGLSRRDVKAGKAKTVRI